MRASYCALHQQVPGLSFVKNMAEVQHMIPSSEFLKTNKHLDGCKVFIPKNFFATDLLPRGHMDMEG